jgi:hypothetical protein
MQKAPRRKSRFLTDLTDHIEELSTQSIRDIAVSNMLLSLGATQV